VNLFSTFGEFIFNPIDPLGKEFSLNTAFEDRKRWGSSITEA